MENTTGHTPGPWTVYHDDEGVLIRVNDDLMGVIINGKEMDANAQLIEAAPKLKAIVEGFLSTLATNDAYQVHRYYDANIELFNLALDTIQELGGVTMTEQDPRMCIPDEVPDSMEQFLEWEFLYELCEECHGDTRHHSAIWIEGARDADLGHHWVVVCIEANRGHAVCEIDECEEHPGEKGLALYG